MVLVLMSVGAVLTVVGIASVAYGIPYNEFGLGNTLIGAGTTALAAGLVIVALSIVLRELIAVRMAVAARALDQGEGSGRPSAAGRTRSVEPPLAALPPEPSSAAVAAERLRATPATRPPSYPTPTASPAPPERTDLPPQPPLRAPPTPPPLRRSDLDGPPGEPPGFRAPVVAPAPPAGPGSDIGLPDSLRARPPGFDRGPPPDRGTDQDAAPPDWTRDPLGEPSSGAGGGDRGKRFFGWTRRRQTVSSDAEAPHAEQAPPPYERTERAEPPSGRAPPRTPSRPVPPPPPRPEPPRPEPPRAEPPPLAEEPAQVTVLKSGVIDGMRYTLYTDGSIDAEFGEDILRFDSIEDLRRHLEQHAG